MGDLFFFIQTLSPLRPRRPLCMLVWIDIINSLKKFRLTRKKMLYFKNEQLKNNYVCLAIFIGVLALI